MMATTHILAGVAIAAMSLGFAPEFALAAAVAGGAGGLFPDLDLYAGHRRTLHFPVYYPAVAVPALFITIIHPTVETVVVGFFLAGAGAHAAVDVLGGGLELRPWRATSDRAVYDHFRGQWIRPRRVVRYDGAPEDLGLAFLLGGSALMVFQAPVSQLILISLGLSVAYTLLRRPLAGVAERIARRLPTPLHPYIPQRYRADPEMRPK